MTFELAVGLQGLATAAAGVIAPGVGAGRDRGAARAGGLAVPAALCRLSEGLSTRPWRVLISPERFDIGIVLGP